MDWLYRARFALEDKEPLSLKQYLIEIKDTIKADERMKDIEEKVSNLSPEDRDRRERTLDEEKGVGVGELIW